VSARGVPVERRPARSAVKDVLVLCYHGVSETWPAAGAATPRNVEAQLTQFLRRGYRGATLSDALTAPQHSRTLVVTFDDALCSVLTLAFPILERLEIPGTVYVPTMYPDSDVPAGWPGYDRWLGTEHEHELRCLSWDDLRTLARAGWEIGSHTDSHPRLTTLDDASLKRELVLSREKCERELSKPCLSLAYPYSNYDNRVVVATRQAGYPLALTVALGAEPPLPLQWPRVIVDRKDTAARVQIRAWRRAKPPVDLAWRRVARRARRLKAIAAVTRRP